MTVYISDFSSVLLRNSNRFLKLISFAVNRYSRLKKRENDCIRNRYQLREAFYLNKNQYNISYIHSVGRNEDDTISST